MEQSSAPSMAPSRRLGTLALSQKSSFSRVFLKVSEGTRTPDRLDHNQELYQLSYAHRGERNLPLPPPPDWISVTLETEMGARIGLGEDRFNSSFKPPVLFPGPAPVAQLDRATAF